MAILTYSITCDYCGNAQEDEFQSDSEAMEFGWYIVRGPERELGGNGERAYCSSECLVADLS